MSPLLSQSMNITGIPKSIIIKNLRRLLHWFPGLPLSWSLWCDWLRRPDLVVPWPSYLLCKLPQFTSTQTFYENYRLPKFLVPKSKTSEGFAASFVVSLGFSLCSEAGVVVPSNWTSWGILKPSTFRFGVKIDCTWEMSASMLILSLSMSLIFLRSSPFSWLRWTTDPRA